MKPHIIKMRIISFIVAMSMVLSLVPVFCVSVFAAGGTLSGGGLSSSDPILISTPADLAAFASSLTSSNSYGAGRYYALTSDIALSGNWTPIATFRGTLYGRNHKISGMTVSVSSGNAGFIDKLEGGTIKDLHIDGNVETTYATGSAGGIMAYITNNSTLSNCSFHGNVYAPRFVGGITCNACPNGGTITIQDCYASGDMYITNASASSSFAAAIATWCGAGGTAPVNGGTINVNSCYGDFDVHNSSSSHISASFSSYICNSATINYKNCYVTGTGFDYSYMYSTDAGTANFTNCYTNVGDIPDLARGSLSATNSYQLWSTSSGGTTSNNVERKTSGFFTSSTNFPSSWDFTNIWKMYSASTFPVLKPYYIDSHEEKTISYYDSSDNTVDLTQFIYKVNDTNYSNFATETFSVDTNVTIYPNVWSNTSYTWTPAGTSKDLASISGNNLILADDAPVGKYKVKIKVENTSTNSTPYVFELTIYKKQHVPAPALDPTPSPAPTYNPGAYAAAAATASPAPSPLTLDDIKLNEGWKWDDTTIIPKNSDGNPYDYYVFKNKIGYKVFYELPAPVNDPTANLADYYDWDDVTNYAATNGYTLTQVASPDGLEVYLDPEVKNSPDSPIVLNIKVEDADTGAPLMNVPVTCATHPASAGLDEFPDPSSQVTNAAGLIYAELIPGVHKFEVTGFTGYDDYSGEFTIDWTSPSNPPVIKLQPARGRFTVPDVLLTPGNTPILGSQVTITKISTNATTSWNGGDPSLTASSGYIIDLPLNTTFMLKNATYGYSTDDTLYVKVTSSGMIEYYSDRSCAAAYAITNTADQVLHAFLLSDPIYTVIIERVGSTDKYTATINLKNIKATYGTFGIKYDPDVFDFTPVVNTWGSGTSVELGPLIGGLTTVEDSYSMYNTTNTSFDPDNGYYDFVWHVDDNTAAVLDTETTAETIAKLTFTLKSGVDPNSASMTWFDIMPWNDTKAAQEYKTVYPTLYPSYDDLTWVHWRDCDADNQTPVAQGRIHESKAVVNGVDTEGFFQASVNPDLSSVNNADFYDVMVNLDYRYDIKNSILHFHTFDKFNNTIDIDNADITLYDDITGAYINNGLTGVSDPSGWKYFYVDTTSGLYGENMRYTVSCLGYWPIPVDGLTTSRPLVNAPTGVVTQVDVPLEKKVYHVPIIQGSGDVQLVQDADLGGQKYAYNNRDFYFRIKAAKGYKITSYPTTATVTMWKDFSAGTSYTATLTPDGNGVFKIDAVDLDQHTLLDLQAAAPTYYNNLTTTLENAYYTGAYNFDPTAQPDADGFRSYNIYIQFGTYTTAEIAYKVEGVTNDPLKGTVTYNYDTSVPELDQDHTADADQPDYRRVTTHISTNPGGVNRKTGTFTFTAEPGYQVEKVYINGLRTKIYDDSPGFTYSFGEVDMDCNITVLFYDGTDADRDKDSLITLVVGEYGYVDTTAPLPAETEISNTRRVYLNKPSLDFKATPIKSDYLINKVEREVEGSGRVNITAGDTYTIPEVKGKNTVVYVTFKNNKADPDTTPNLFVKSYVMQGMGVVKPAGILIYCLHDTVDIDLEGESPYSAKGVEVQDFDTLAPVGNYNFPTLQPNNTYTIASLEKDIAIGAIFEEPGFDLNGLIDLSQDANITIPNCISGATIRFVRLDDTTFDEKPSMATYIFTSTNARKTAAFSGSLPAGWWNVYVEKPGYLTYKITKFEMKDDGSTSSFGNGNKIVPYIGATTTGGKYIYLPDAANIKSGWRAGANSAIKDRADVDNDGTVCYYDMTYVWHNYNKRLITQEYSDFYLNGSLGGTPPVTTPVTLY